ncbi:MAG: sensor protein evgS [Herbaspirillum sp.]|nr:sensor protein evgS [Herbaspirillum sp.]
MSWLHRLRCIACPAALTPLLLVWPLLLSSLALPANTEPAAAPQQSAKQAPLFNAQELAWIAANPVVHIAVDPYLQPLEYVENGKYQGLTSDYIAAISRASGLRFEMVPVAANKIAGALETGDIDLVTAVSPTFTEYAIRRQLIISPPYFAGGTIIITRGYDEIIFDPHKLDGRTVALKGGGMYEQTLRRLYPAITMKLVDTPALALAAVAAKQADAAIGIDSVLLPILHTKYRDQLHVSGSIADVPAVISIGVREQLPQLASIVGKTLASLNARQTTAMTDHWLAHNPYGPPSWAQFLRYRWLESTLVLVALLSLLLAAQRARHARRVAEKNDRDKARFLAVMSHEIRTPMNAILSSVELLARSKLTQQQRQLSDLASNASEALLELLDDVLDLSKLEARRLTLTKVPTDLQQLARGVVDIAELQARTKQLDIALVVDLPAATDLLLDPGRIRQILINLTSNAVKFTEHGLVQVSIALEHSEPSQAPEATLLLSVSDTGIGVPLDRQKDLFRPYHQAHRTSTRRFGGTGLGLAICRELCELMGGSIRFDSTPDVGSTVICRIPVELAPQIPADEAPLPLIAAPAAGLAPHILVVEDHPGNRMVLQQQLTQLGYRFTIVGDGLSALEQTAHQAFALMLLDCYLPDIDGYTVARRQRAREAGKSHLPIIAISAAFDQEHLDTCISSGMDGTLRKPLRLTALEKLLNGWCGPGHILPAAEAEAGTEAEVEANQASPGDADPVEIFMRAARDDLADLEQAIKQRTYDRAARVAHRMRGAALVCKWPHIADLALAIEAEFKGPTDQEKMAEIIARLHLALESDTSGR